MAKSKKPVVKFKNIPTQKELGSKNQEARVKKRDISVKMGLFSNIPAQSANVPIPEKKKEETVTVPPTVQQQPISEAKEVAVVVPEQSTETAPVLAKNKDFPRISRVITERWFLVGLFAGVLMIVIAVIGGDIRANLKEKSVLEQQRMKIQEQITYWQGNVKKYPGYRDGYFQLAVLEYQLGDIQASQDYLNKVESLDPNFQEAYKLEGLLNGK